MIVPIDEKGCKITNRNVIDLKPVIELVVFRQRKQVLLLHGNDILHEKHDSK
jgi:hypothetical protein